MAGDADARGMRAGLHYFITQNGSRTSTKASLADAGNSEFIATPLKTITEFTRINFCIAGFLFYAIPRNYCFLDKVLQFTFIAHSI